jgi:hypothetical protein
MKTVMQTQAKSPDDPASNLEIGRFLCFVKGSWDLGLRFIVKGSDQSLKALAGKELAFPTQTADRVALADGWYDLAEKEKSPLRKSQLFAHSKGIYEGALVDAPGLLRSKVEKRLSDLEQQDVTGSVNLLRLIDPKLDGVSGQWKFENGTLVCGSAVLTRLQIPYLPPEEYDLTAQVARRSGADVVTLGLVAGGVQFQVSIDANSGQGGMTFLEILDGAKVDGNPTLTRGVLMLTGTDPHTVVCSVRKKGVTVTVDSKKVIAWEGDYHRFSLNPSWKVPNNRCLFIGTWEVDLRVTRLFLTPVSGPGKKLR